MTAWMPEVGDEVLPRRAARGPSVTLPHADGLPLDWVARRAR
jgi:hypothetical protein